MRLAKPPTIIGAIRWWASVVQDGKLARVVAKDCGRAGQEPDESEVIDDRLICYLHVEAACLAHATRLPVGVLRRALLFAVDHSAADDEFDFAYTSFRICQLPPDAIGMEADLLLRQAQLELLRVREPLLRSIGAKIGVEFESVRQRRSRDAFLSPGASA